MGGDGETSVRVKFKFGGRCKVAKLGGTINTPISSMESLRKLIFKHFPEIQGMVACPPPGPPLITGVAPTHLLSVSCKDMAKDYIILENDEDLDAMEIALYRNLDFCIDVIPMPLSASGTASTNTDRWQKFSDGQISAATLASNIAILASNISTLASNIARWGTHPHQWRKLSDRPLSAVSAASDSDSGESCRIPLSAARAASDSDKWENLSDRQLSKDSVLQAGNDIKKMRHCRYFRSGFCMHGDSCQYLHDPNKRVESLPSPIVVDWCALKPNLPLKKSEPEELQSHLWRLRVV